MSMSISLKEYLALVLLSMLNLFGGEITFPHILVSGFLSAIIPIYVETHYKRK